MSDKKRVVIVGGVAGGASAAARARRLSEDAEIVMFERGAYISFANCGLPYHIAGHIKDRERLLVQTPEGMRSRYKIDVRISTEVTSIDRARKEVVAFDRVAGREYRERYDDLILSPGAEPIRPPIRGIDSEYVLPLRNLSDMDAIVSLLGESKVRRAVVIGGGYIGLEMTEALRERGLEVTLVELAKQVMGPADPEMAAPLHQELKLHGVDLRLGTSVTEFAERDGALDVLLSTGESLRAGLAILAVGVKPESRLARDAGLEIGKLGGIVVDDHMRTSDPHIYAVGDAIEVDDLIAEVRALIPLAGPANRQGRIAADNILGRDSVYKKTQGTAICKVFGLAIGMTGVSERSAKRHNIPYEKVYVHPASHASYYPGASPISLKLLFDPKSGRVLGAQAVGASGVDKRIDVLAVAIRAGFTVFDLEDLELSYAPPYGSAKDVVNYAGFVAANVLRGDTEVCQVEHVVSPKEDQALLDVRTDAEVAGGTIPGAIHIPVDSLRSRMNELPRNKEILVFCQVGLRGYLACRMLKQNGFRCRNLTGGYKTYVAATGFQPKRPAEPKEMKDDTGEKSAIPPAAPQKAPSPPGTPKVAARVDASGLQCPGPIQRLKTAIDSVKEGEAVVIVATDSGFAADVPSWCRATGNELAELAPINGAYAATVVKRAPSGTCVQAPSASCKDMTIIVFSGDFDKAVAAFIIANGAASMGLKPTLFFTFWGLNVLCRDNPVSVKKTLVERMFGWMMPRGARKLALSRMNMAGMGLAMIKGIMKKKNVSSLPDLIASARAGGVRLVACAMTMDLMGIKPEELIDGVETGGVAAYLEKAATGTVNLFI